MSGFPEGPSAARRLAIATTNPHKIAEFRRLLAPLPLELVPVEPRVPEDGSTYLANALAKARAAASRSGLPAMADDSGIEVDALGGFPGVRSARWAAPGEANRLLLARLDGVPAEERSARMVAVVALVDPAGGEAWAEGVVQGRIADRPRGHRGFGYDPLFLLPDGRTLAERDDEEKDRVSHRGEAVRKLWHRLQALCRAG